MPSIKKILYATDFSKSSARAADYASYLAGLTGASIHVLHVIGELTDPRRNMIQPEAYALFEKEVQTETVREMEAFCKQRFGAGVAYTTEVVVGSPFQQIVALSEAIKADLIIMGTHGRTGLEHVIVGSNAERVVRKSKIPVLTVRQEG